MYKIKQHLCPIAIFCEVCITIIGEVRLVSTPYFCSISEKNG